MDETPLDLSLERPAGEPSLKLNTLPCIEPTPGPPIISYSGPQKSQPGIQHQPNNGIRQANLPGLQTPPTSIQGFPHQIKYGAPQPNLHPNISIAGPQVNHPFNSGGQHMINYGTGEMQPPKAHQQDSPPIVMISRVNNITQHHNLPPGIKHSPNLMECPETVQLLSKTSVVQNSTCRKRSMSDNNGPSCHNCCKCKASRKDFGPTQNNNVMVPQKEPQSQPKMPVANETVTKPADHMQPPISGLSGKELPSKSAEGDKMQSWSVNFIQPVNSEANLRDQQINNVSVINTADNRSMSGGTVAIHSAVSNMPIPLVRLNLSDTGTMSFLDPNPPQNVPSAKQNLDTFETSDQNLNVQGNTQVFNSSGLPANLRMQGPNNTMPPKSPVNQDIGPPGLPTGSNIQGSQNPGKSAVQPNEGLKLRPRLPVSIPTGYPSGPVQGFNLRGLPPSPSQQGNLTEHSPRPTLASSGVSPNPNPGQGLSVTGPITNPGIQGTSLRPPSSPFVPDMSFRLPVASATQGASGLPMSPMPPPVSPNIPLSSPRQALSPTGAPTSPITHVRSPRPPSIPRQLTSIGPLPNPNQAFSPAGPTNSPHMQVPSPRQPLPSPRQCTESPVIPENISPLSPRGLHLNTITHDAPPKGPPLSTNIPKQQTSSNSVSVPSQIEGFSPRNTTSPASSTASSCNTYLVDEGIRPMCALLADADDVADDDAEDDNDDENDDDSGIMEDQYPIPLVSRQNSSISSSEAGENQNTDHETSSPQDLSTKNKDIDSIYECKSCGKHFNHFLLLTEHQLNGCGTILMDIPLSDPENAQNHKIDRGIHVCNICNATYKARGVLSRHIGRVHSSRGRRKAMENFSKVSTCPVCGDWFTTTQRFKNHMKVHDNQDLASYIYICTICGGRYMQENQLERHIKRVHLASVMTRKQSYDKYPLHPHDVHTR